MNTRHAQFSAATITTTFAAALFSILPFVQMAQDQTAPPAAVQNVAVPAPAATANLPDLAVTAVRVFPERPFAGDRVSFRAVVTNRGTAPTPDGVILGGVFKLNGSVYAFTDRYKHALAPGESVILTANGGGGAGDGTWLAAPGTYTLGFLVDDVNRIQESDKRNNEFTAPSSLTVVAFNGPDLVVRRVTWRTTALTDGTGRQTGTTAAFRAEIANIGNAPTPAGTPILTRFRVNGAKVADAVTMQVLRPGQSVTVTGSDVLLPSGVYQVEAIADPNGKLRERRTDNNRLLRQFHMDSSVTLQPRPADAFANSIGVCTHLSYYDTTYGRFDVIKARLIESGIRHIRDGASSAQSDIIQKMNDLAAHGIRTTLIVNPRTLAPEQAVALVKTLKKAVAAVEGPNEPNLFYADLFPNGIREYQQKLYTALKADPETAPVPVLSPALAFPGEIAARVGPVACDYGAMHPYPGGQLPDAGLDETIKATRIVAPGKPLITTETGYDTAIHVTSGQPAVSESAEAKYIPRLLFESFQRGVERAFLYEFADEKPEPAMTDAEQHFGILRADGSPKPAFTAIANLIHFLQDRPAASANSKSAGRPFALRPLRLRLRGDVTDLRSLVLQKRDGRQYLILWVNGRSYDQDAKADATIAPQAVVITFDTPFARAAVYRPAQSAKPVATYGPSSSLKLAILDEPLVIELVRK